jgi:hypothetical protein
MDDIYTQDEIETIMKTDTAKLDAVESKLAAAEARFVQGQTWAHESLGDDGVAAFDKVNLPELEKLRDQTARTAEAVHANARAIRQQTDQTQITLTPDEYAEAAGKALFVKEDCENLPFGKLLDAVRYCVLKDDRPGLFLWSKYVPTRIAQADKDGTWNDSKEKEELRRLMTVVAGKLQDKTLEPLSKRASDLLVRAGKLSRLATKNRQQTGRYIFQSEGEVPW